MSAYTLEVTEQEINYLLTCINNDVKANGLNVAANGLHMATKLKGMVDAQNASAPPVEKVEETDGK